MQGKVVKGSLEPQQDATAWSSEQVLKQLCDINGNELERRAIANKPYYDFTTGYVISYAYSTEKLMSKVSYWYVYKLIRLEKGHLQLLPIKPAG